MYDHRTLTILDFREFAKECKGDLLDVGCRGADLKPVFEDMGFIWHGMDIDPKDIIVKKGDMHNLPYENSTMDFIFSCHSFEHVENPSQVLREFARVLRPNGWVYISMPIFGEKYIVNADNDHINVLHPWQMKRLVLYGKQFELADEYRQENPGAPEQDNQIYILKRLG